MTLAAVDLAHLLRQHDLLDPAQCDEVERDLRPRFPDPRALARELLQRGWLTPFQLNQVFLGKAADLILGQYLLQERLGEGGMGSVFKARHRRLGRVDALKVIRKDRVGNRDAIRRFQREVRAAARLSHPNIVEVYDADEVDGSHFLAMQFVEGRDLSRLVKEGGPLPVWQACACVRQAALGLDHAHAQGLVHRDIKPANLMLTQAPSASKGTVPSLALGACAGSGTPMPGVVKILDLGLALLTQQTDDGLSGPLTRDGVVMGTLDYLAPEQAWNSRLVDGRADLYSLGCTLVYLLTGSPPFPGGSVMEKLVRHREEAPPALETLCPGVPRGLADVVVRMLAKRAADRYATAADLAADLQPFCSAKSAGFAAAVGPAPALTPGDASGIAGVPPGLTEEVVPAPALVGLSARAWEAPVAAAERDTFAGLRDDTPSGTPAPLPPRRRRRRRGIGLVAGLSLMFLAAIFLVSWLASRHPGPLPAPPHPPAPPVLPPKVEPFTLDLLDPDKIPAAERFPWQPMELVAVLGRHGSGKEAKPGIDLRVVKCLALSPDGRTVAVGGEGPLLRLWDLATFAERRLPAPNPTNSLAFALDGKLLVVGTTSRTDLVDVVEGEVKKPIYVQGRMVVSPDGKQLALASNATLRRWGLPAGQALSSHPLGFPAKWQQAVFGPDGQVIAVAVQGEATRLDNGVRLFDLAGRPGRLLPRHTWIRAETLTASPDGKRLAWWADHFLWVWDVPAGVQRAKVSGILPGRLALSPDGKWLAATVQDGNPLQSLLVLDVATGKVERTIPLPVKDLQTPVGCVFAPDSRHLLLTFASGPTYVLRLRPPPAPKPADPE